MNKETVRSVKEKSMYRNAIQLNTVIKERTNEGLMNHRKKERERGGKIKACMQLRLKKKKKVVSEEALAGTENTGYWVERRPYLPAVTTRMTPASRWAESHFNMLLMNSEGQSDTF